MKPLQVVTKKLGVNLKIAVMQLTVAVDPSEYTQYNLKLNHLIFEIPFTLKNTLKIQ